MDRISSYMTKVAKKIMLCETNVGGTDRVYFIDLGGESNLELTMDDVLKRGGNGKQKFVKEEEPISLETHMKKIYPHGYQYDAGNIITLRDLLEKMYIPKLEKDKKKLDSKLSKHKEYLKAVKKYDDEQREKEREKEVDVINKQKKDTDKLNRNIALNDELKIMLDTGTTAHVVYQIIEGDEIFLIPNSKITQLDEATPLPEGLTETYTLKHGDEKSFRLYSDKSLTMIEGSKEKKCVHPNAKDDKKNDYVKISFWAPWDKTEFTNVYPKHYGNTNINKYNFYEMVMGYDGKVPTTLKEIVKFYLGNVCINGYNSGDPIEVSDDGGYWYAGSPPEEGSSKGDRKKKSRRKYRKRKYKKSNRSKKMKRNKSRRKRLSKRR